MVGKRVQSHVVEKVIFFFMALFGLAAVYIFWHALKLGAPAPEVAIIEILLLLVLAIFGQTVVLVKIYEQNLQREK